MASIERLPHPSYVTLYASAARTATPTATTYYNDSARGILIHIDCTAASATPSVQPTLDWSGDGGTSWNTAFSAAAAITGTGDTTYMIYPGILASADGSFTESLNMPLPRVWRLVLTHADTDSITYAVYAQYL